MPKSQTLSAKSTVRSPISKSNGMEVVFEIEYRTVWGEVLVWNDGRRRVAMTYGAGSRWHCRLELPAGEIRYGYEVECERHVVRREWRGHRLTLTSDMPQWHICDRWSERPADAPFYSSAFTEGIFARKKRRTVHGPVAGNLTLTVQAPTVRPGQVLALAGSTPELGEWSRFQLLDDADFPQWSITLAATASFEYKFVLLDRRTKRPVWWEEGENRRLDLHQREAGRMVVADLQLHGTTPPWRGAGCAVPLFSLRTREDFGVGEFPDLKRMVDWAVGTGQRVLQLLPVNDTIRSRTRRDSYPYNAISSFALHPLYLSLTEAGLKPDARYRREQQRLNALAAVDYETVMARKLAWAAQLYRDTWKNVCATEEYRCFYEANRSWLDPYAVFSVLRDRKGTADFRQWGDDARYNEDRVSEFISKNPEEVGFYLFLQYHLHRQLRDASRYARQHSVLLKGDIPIGVSPASVDVWCHPTLFRCDEQAGAPPDAFAAEGQNWGFPTYNWEAMARDGYGWWLARLRKMAEYFDAYRIDHILGFFRIWEIPVDAVRGLLGHFRPALPYSREELAASGFDLSEGRYTRPAVNDKTLKTLFGSAAGAVKRQFIVDGELRSEVATQRRIVAHFGARSDHRRRRLCEGLLRLCEEVLFLEDAERPGFYHPRIAAQNTFLYRQLDEAHRQAFDRLHEAYFYHRHNDFWREEALRKLPALLDATPMLACGEDLGMIPACVPEVMAQLRILSLEVERMSKHFGERFGDPSGYPYLSVGTTSTHDMSPLRNWWQEDPTLTQRYFSEVLHRRGKAPAELSPELCRRIVERTLGGRSMFAILPLQDWLATDAALRRPDPGAERINDPADSENYWNYRMHLTMEELLESDEFNRNIRSMLRRSGRSHS